jgi:two-component system CheB/CheR fusion protein
MTWATKWPVSQQGEPGLRILIVEDNADSAESMACLLRHYGYEIEVASNGLTALEAVKGRHPDVVLLDIGLPDIDGWEVAKRLKETDSPKRPLIIADRVCPGQRPLPIGIVRD